MCQHMNIFHYNESYNFLTDLNNKEKATYGVRVFLTATKTDPEAKTDTSSTHTRLTIS